MLHSIVKRGLVHIAQAPAGHDSGLTTREWIARAMLIGTVVVFVIASSLVGYICSLVITTLAAVEDPSVTVYTTDDSPDNPKEPLLEKTGTDRVVDLELHLVQNRPITSSFRTTLRHLRQDGLSGPFRGAAVAFVYSVAITFTTGLMSWLPAPLATITATLICARLDLAWNNIVISKASPKYWFRRIPTIKSWVKVLPAAALFAVANQLAVLLPTQLARMNGLQHLIDSLNHLPDDSEERRAIMHTLCRSGSAVFLVAVATTVLILIPASVTLTRVQASLLPEEEETIVPFDRSFGGKVVPESLGGQGVVGILEAWKSFGWSSRIRLLKVYVKAFALQTLLFTLFGLTLVAQVAVFAPDLGNVLVTTTSP